VRYGGVYDVTDRSKLGDLILQRDISEFRPCEQILNILDQWRFSLLRFSHPGTWIASTTLNIFGFPFFLSFIMFVFNYFMFINRTKFLVQIFE